MTCRFTSEEYAFYVLGILDGQERSHIRDHLREGCETCRREMKEALEFWYVFAALTERTQAVTGVQLNPALRRRVLDVGRRSSVYQMVRSSNLRVWMQVAAGLLLMAGAAKVSWDLGQSRIKSHVTMTQARIEQQAASLKSIEAENIALRSLVAAVRNAPPVFPGREGIVSVQDPYLVRELQRAKQTQTALSQALSEERVRSADLGKRLSQTTTLLAAATRDQEDSDRRSRKMFDAAMLETRPGPNSIPAEIGAFNTKVQELQAQVAKDRALINAQSKGMDQYSQVMSFLRSSTVTLVHLKPLRETQASGVALIADDSKLAFFPLNLPAPPEGRTYQLWIIRDKVPFIINAGTIDRIAKDGPSLHVTSYLSMAGAKELAVTEEPSGGSPQPTGRKLMEGVASRR